MIRNNCLMTFRLYLLEKRVETGRPSYVHYRSNRGQLKCQVVGPISVTQRARLKPLDFTLGD
jgi:hypothetical protein